MYILCVDNWGVGLFHTHVYVYFVFVDNWRCMAVSHTCICIYCVCLKGEFITDAPKPMQINIEFLQAYIVIFVHIYQVIWIWCTHEPCCVITISRLFEFRRTERAENHMDRQYCQVCQSGCPTKFVACVFCFAPEIGNATGMPERSRSTRN